MILKLVRTRRPSDQPSPGPVSPPEPLRHNTALAAVHLYFCCTSVLLLYICTVLLLYICWAFLWRARAGSCTGAGCATGWVSAGSLLTFNLCHDPSLSLKLIVRKGFVHHWLQCSFCSYLLLFCSYYSFLFPQFIPQ